MNKAAKTLVLTLSFVSLVIAQDQDRERRKTDVHRDFPNVQMILPSIPPWRFNFDTNRWEREQDRGAELALPDDDDDLLRALRALGTPHTRRVKGKTRKPRSRQHHSRPRHKANSATR